jgi:hypothetical protein
MSELLEKWGRVPATIRDTELVEPVEPREPSTDLEVRGRTPEEVVERTRERDPFDISTPEPTEPSEPTIQVAGRQLTSRDVEELAKAYQASQQQLARRAPALNL